MQPDNTSIVYGTDRPRLLAGRTLFITSGPTYDSVRAYGIWLPNRPLLVTVSGIATGNLTVAWEYPWREQTTQVWRNAIIQSAMSTRHNHRHGLKPGHGNRSRNGGDHRRPAGPAPARPHQTGHAAYPGLNQNRRTTHPSSARAGTNRRTDPDAGTHATSGVRT